MKTRNYIVDRIVFVITWLGITSISTVLATVFVVGLKSLF